MHDPLLGYQLGSYRLMQVLGQGSFAQVYRGQHVHLEVFAAIKVLHAQLGEQEKQGFHKEALLLTTLKHPHIIRFLDYGFIGGRPYLITDLAKKGSLSNVYPRGTRLPLPQIVTYATQIAAGLEFAHAQHIVHRDIKPENILVSDSGELLLADFGIAKLLGTANSSMTNNMAGTLPYMAPEMFDGRPSPSSDQYALGVMVYGWLAGRLPFEGSAGELIRHHLQDQPPPLRSFNPSISPEVESVVMTSIKKHPEQRFRTVQAFARALGQAAGMGAHPSRPIAQVELPLSGDPQFGQGNLNVPLQAGVISPVAAPQPVVGLASDPSIPQPLNAPLPSDPGHDIVQPVVSQQPLLTDPGAWQKLMPPQKSLAFTELPSLPQAQLTDYWWPTFIVPLEQRRKINQGTVSFEILSGLGPLTSFPSPSIVLPISEGARPLSLGSLASAQRISVETSVASPDPVQSMPIQQSPAVQASGGRVASSAHPQAGGARTAQTAIAGTNQPLAPNSGSSRSTVPTTIAFLALIIGFIFESVGGSNQATSALVGSWLCEGVAIIACIVGLTRTKPQQKVLRGWLIVCLILAIFLLIAAIFGYNTISSTCSSC